MYKYEYEKVFMLLDLAILILHTTRFSQYSPEMVPKCDKVQSNKADNRFHHKMRPLIFRLLLWDSLVLGSDSTF